jgi:bacterioferritin-associated ferredoxin
MYLCHCRAVTGRAVRAAIASGARNIEDIKDSCNAGLGCGGCLRMLQAYLDASLGVNKSADDVDHLPRARAQVGHRDDVVKRVWETERENVER